MFYCKPIADFRSSRLLKLKNKDQIHEYVKRFVPNNIYAVSPPPHTHTHTHTASFCTEVTVTRPLYIPRFFRAKFQTNLYV